MKSVAELESQTMGALHALAKRIRRLEAVMQNEATKTLLTEIADELEEILERSGAIWDQVEAIGERLIQAKNERAQTNRDRAAAVVNTFIGSIRARDDAPEAYRQMVEAIGIALYHAERGLEIHRPIVVHALQQLLASETSEGDAIAARAALDALKD